MFNLVFCFISSIWFARRGGFFYDILLNCFCLSWLISNFIFLLSALRPLFWYNLLWFSFFIKNSSYFFNFLQTIFQRFRLLNLNSHWILQILWFLNFFLNLYLYKFLFLKALFNRWNLLLFFLTHMHLQSMHLTGSP